MAPRVFGLFSKTTDKVELEVQQHRFYTQREHLLRVACGRRRMIGSPFEGRREQGMLEADGQPWRGGDGGGMYNHGR